MTIDSSFWLAVSTIVAAFLVFMLRTIFASKCRMVNILWGCLMIDRDVDIEMRDIRQSPERNHSSRSGAPLPPLISSRPVSRASSPISVLDIEKIDLDGSSI